MKSTILYSSLAIATVVGIGLYYKGINTQSNSCTASGLSKNIVQ